MAPAHPLSRAIVPCHGHPVQGTLGKECLRAPQEEEEGFIEHTVGPLPCQTLEVVRVETGEVL